MIDRIDIHIDVPRVDYEKLSNDMRIAEIRQFYQLEEISESLMRSAMSQLQLLACGYHRVLTLAWTDD